MSEFLKRTTHGKKPTDGCAGQRMEDQRTNLNIGCVGLGGDDVSTANKS